MLWGHRRADVKNGMASCWKGRRKCSMYPYGAGVGCWFRPTQRSPPRRKKSLCSRIKTQTKTGPRNNLQKAKFDLTFRISSYFLDGSHFWMVGRCSCSIYLLSYNTSRTVWQLHCVAFCTLSTPSALRLFLTLPSSLLRRVLYTPTLWIKKLRQAKAQDLPELPRGTSWGVWPRDLLSDTVNIASLLTLWSWNHSELATETLKQKLYAQQLQKNRGVQRPHLCQLLNPLNTDK